MNSTQPPVSCVYSDPVELCRNKRGLKFTQRSDATNTALHSYCIILNADQLK